MRDSLYPAESKVYPAESATDPEVANENVVEELHTPDGVLHVKQGAGLKAIRFANVRSGGCLGSFKRGGALNADQIKAVVDAIKQFRAEKSGVSSGGYLDVYRGGNPLAIANVAVEGTKALTGLATGIADAVDKGRHTTLAIDKETGALDVQKAENENRRKIEQSVGFQKYYRDLAHTRYWNDEMLPPHLRLWEFGPWVGTPFSVAINWAANRDAKKRADDALYKYALETYKG